MSFILPKGARTFFKALDGSGQERWLLFDSWYVCMMLGVQKRQLGPKKELEGPEFISEYPEAFRPQSDFIAGLLIDAELTRQKIDLEDKASVQGEMVKLLDPSRATSLHEDGIELLNRYAVAGFEELQERMPPPARIEDLLVTCADFWAHREAAKSNGP